MSPFPQMLYRAPGPHEIHGRMLDYTEVANRKAFDEAIADGWHETTDEAIAAADKATQEEAERREAERKDRENLPVDKRIELARKDETEAQRAESDERKAEEKAAADANPAVGDPKALADPNPDFAFQAGHGRAQERSPGTPYVPPSELRVDASGTNSLERDLAGDAVEQAALKVTAGKPSQGDALASMHPDASVQPGHARAGQEQEEGARVVPESDLRKAADGSNSLTRGKARELIEDVQDETAKEVHRQHEADKKGRKAK